MSFTSEVIEKLGVYVYRLIDPRNGETFYVGKGQGNRIFAHVADELGEAGDNVSDKLQRIRDIRLSGLEVAHVIHRHGMDDNTAYEVEAALIDAFPSATNLAGGYHSDERGAMHSIEIIEKYQAPTADFYHDLVAININRTATERTIYEAVRYAWKISPDKASRADYVLAVQSGLIVGVFVADEWLAATPKNFPGTTSPRDGRWGFIGREASSEIKNLYLRKRLPDELRKRGSANPIRYIAART